MPSLQDWSPTHSPSQIWRALSARAFVCIFDHQDWRIVALNGDNAWFYRGSDWSNLRLTHSSKSIDFHSDTQQPPFREGWMNLLSFDGTLHSWYADHSLAYHQPTQRWYFWGNNTHKKQIEQDLDHEDLDTAGSSSIQNTPSKIDPRFSMTKAQYLEAVQQIQAEIRQGNVYQINLAHEIGPFHTAAPLDLWLEITASNPARHSVFWKSPSECLLSNSPELFLKIDANGQICSTPIKGTHPNADAENAYTELKDSPKEEAELAMIVDMMRNDISMVADYGSVYAEERQIVRCGDLLHAEQTVHGILREGISTLNAVHACFPPASVTGAPKRSALSYIRALEPVERGWYTGSFGFIDARGHSVWNVLIRTLQGACTEQNEAILRLNIGAGIVYDSNPELEWEETLAKGRAIQRVMLNAERSHKDPS